MQLRSLVPFMAMAGVGAMLLLTSRRADDRPWTKLKRNSILLLGAGTGVACCVAGAESVAQILRLGLAATPPPTTLGTIARLVGVAIAIALWPIAHRSIERAVTFTFIIGAGASGLIGLGLRYSVLDAARIVYHALTFACGAVLAAGVVAKRASDATDRPTFSQPAHDRSARENVSRPTRTRRDNQGA